MRTTGGRRGAAEMTRRHFLALSAGGAAGTLLTGCAVNPVTGKKQLMLLSEDEEIKLDQAHSPHQISADYGPVQDPALNRYLTEVCQPMASQTHRPHMPYTYRVVNATYFNAYAFLGGTIAATRGMLLALENEAALGAVMGHELGHVNARHSAHQMSKGMMANLMVAAVAAGMSTSEKTADWAPLAAGLGAVAAGALLAHYSRENERQADALGMEYAVKAGYNPSGMIDLMDAMMDTNEQKPGVIEMMFATHPFSGERYETAKQMAATQYAGAAGLPVQRERYMDHTARLRAQRGAIESMQKGQASMRRKAYQQAYDHYVQALRQAPDDYAGLLLLAECCQAMGRNDEARHAARRAKAVNPGEPQAHFVQGMAAVRAKDFAEGHQEFAAYKRMLPGNPNVTFWNGLALEGLGRRNQAANEYKAYLAAVGEGELAGHAHQRLTQWGFIKKEGS